MSSMPVNSPLPFSIDDLPNVIPPPFATIFTRRRCPLRQLTVPVPLCGSENADQPCSANVMLQSTSAARADGAAAKAARKTIDAASVFVSFMRSSFVQYAGVGELPDPENRVDVGEAVRLLDRAGMRV